MGIDPGLNNVGWAILKDEETLVDYGCIENKKAEVSDYGLTLTLSKDD